MSIEMTVKALAPWFGGKRTLAPIIVEQLGKHTQYFEPFCGSMAVLFAKPPSQKETVNDLHGDLINLARVVQNEETAIVLYKRLSRVLLTEDILNQAREQLDGDVHLDAKQPCSISRAYWYFLASWMARNGTAGTARADYQMAVRWTKGGGSPTVRWTNAVDSIPAWHRRLQNVVILQRVAFRIFDRFEDVEGTAIYCDPPYIAESRTAMTKSKGSSYLHEFDHSNGMFGNDHIRLAEVLKRYKKARVVLSYYDHSIIRDLYKDWIFIKRSRQKHLHSQSGRGFKPKVAPEIIIVNGPEY